MKKTTKLFFLLLIAVTTHAQVEKGRIMLGGNVNYQQRSGKSDPAGSDGGSKSTYTSFSTGLRGGYFLADNLMAGVLLGRSGNTSDHESPLSQPNSDTRTEHGSNVANSAGLFGRYYYVIGKSKFAVFGQLEISYGLGNYIGQTSDYNQGVLVNESQVTGSSQQFSSLLGLGLTYFATTNIAIEAYFGEFGYSHLSSQSKTDGNPAGEYSQSGFNSNINFNLSSLYLGVNFYFGGSSAAQSK